MTRKKKEQEKPVEGEMNVLRQLVVRWKRPGGGQGQTVIDESDAKSLFDKETELRKRGRSLEHPDEDESTGHI